VQGRPEERAPLKRAFRAVFAGSSLIPGTCFQAHLESAGHAQLKQR